MTARAADPLNNPSLWRPAKCAVCTRCFQNMRAAAEGVTRCYFGGPFTGYVRLP